MLPGRSGVGSGVVIFVEVLLAGVLLARDVAVAIPVVAAVA
jgi:hypothetical protein